MNSTASLTAADRIVMTLEGLFRAVAARRRISVLVGRGTEVLAEALIVLICARVRRVERRIVWMLARFREGRLRVWDVAPGSRTLGAGVTRVSRRAEGTLPRRFAWLLPLVPCEAANYAAQLRLALADPEMIALLRAAPQARRVLEPLCRMLGIEAEVLTPPDVAAIASEPVAAEAARDVPRAVGAETGDGGRPAPVALPGPPWWSG